MVGKKPMTRKEIKARYAAKQKKVREGAKVIHAKSMKQICKRDKLLYNSLLAYPALVKFGLERKMATNDIIIVMLMDLYTTITLNDVRAWGVYLIKQHWYRCKKRLKESGYVETSNAGTKKIHFLTMKGKALVRDFNAYYDESVTRILKSTGNGKETIRKVTRSKLTGKHQPSNSVAGKEFVADSEG